MLSSSSRFNSLPTRPPTPPRDVSRDTAIDQALAFLDEGHEITGVTINEKLAVPANTQSVASHLATRSESVSSKKVDFSPWPTYHKTPRLGLSSSPTVVTQKRSPSSREVKPRKSILKLSATAPLTPDELDRRFSYFSPEIPGSFAKMLQSVVQHLANPSRSARLDAYLTFNGVLKKYESIPDPQAVIPKMGLIMQFLSRDMAWKDAEGNLDANIVTQALKLTAAILNDPKLREAVDDDFKTFVIDRSIVVLQQNENISKPVLKMQMFLLAQQRFSSLIVTPARTEKIIAALKDIEVRCSGNSVVSARLVIYQRLVDQSPSVVLAKIPDWLGHVFHGMLSSIKDIRVRAIEMAGYAGFVLGTHPQAAKSLVDLLETEAEQDHTYFDYITARLQQMVAEKELGEYVPQIWAAITLFFRTKRRPLDKWPRFKSWLLVIQKCLNASDAATRQQAYLAWNKLVFTIMPDSTTSAAFLPLLKVPIYTGMDKRGADKHSKQHRQCALNSFYNLVHYSLRPGLTHEDYDLAWDTFVDPLFSQSVIASAKGRLTACRVLHGLATVHTGTWNANVALETAALQPEVLPKMEPRWVRSRLGKLLRLLQPMLISSMHSARDDTALLDATWTSLMQLLAEAGCQEVRTSTDLKHAVALLVNLFRSIWDDMMLRAENATATDWITRYVSLMDIMISHLGVTVFTEDFLTTKHDSGFEVAPTPSSKSKHQSPAQSPMVILFGLFFGLTPTTVAQPFDGTAITSILRFFLSSRSSPAAKLEVLGHSLSTWSTDETHQSCSGNLTVACAAVLDVALDALSSDLQPSDQNSQSFGSNLRNALAILTATLRLFHDTPEPELLRQAGEFYVALCLAAKRGAGDGGVVHAVMEPFALSLSRMDTSDTRLSLTMRVMRQGVWPRTRQDMEKAKKALWGVSVAPGKATTYDPFLHVYTLITDIMTDGLHHIRQHGFSQHNLQWQAISETFDFFKRAPVDLLWIALRQTQSGFVTWVTYPSKDDSFHGDVVTAACMIWGSVLDLLRGLSKTDSESLKVLEPLYGAAFSSPYRGVVNRTIEFWNETYGSEPSLNYPTHLESILRARSADAELLLPGFPESGNGHELAVLPELYESQRPDPPQAMIQPTVDTTPLVTFASPRNSRLAHPKKEDGQMSTPMKLTPKPKARLRHEDSQLQFAPIESSPMIPSDGSQMLTDHQKEVAARQHEAARMFQDFSSSPIIQSTSLPQLQPKRLDFTVDRTRSGDDEIAGTPIGLQLDGNLASDDLPSSPTPSSNKAATPHPSDFADEMEEDDLRDPPSSPPRADDTEAGAAAGGSQIQPFHTSNAATEAVDPGQQTWVENANDQETAAGADIVEDTNDNDEADVDLPSDSWLPTAQLHQEEAAAIKSGSQANGIENPEANNTDGDDDDPYDTNRVADSFIANDPAHEASNSETRRVTRKRKRRVTKTVAGRKRKQNSAVEPVFTSVFSQDQDDSDDDIEDEIVVASSQRSMSPVSAHPDEDGTGCAPDTGSIKSEDELVAIEPPSGEAHERRSESPTPLPMPASEQSEIHRHSTRSLKRKASDINITHDRQEASRPKEISASPRMTRQRSSRSQQEPSVNTRPSHRRHQNTVASVVIPVRRQSPEVAAPEPEDAEAVDHQPTPTKPARDETASTPVRPIASPRSIIGRLRSALCDLKGIFVPAEDERAFDDVLFELRREVHEAGRRGREQDQLQPDS